MEKTKEVFWRFQDGKKQCTVFDARKDIQAYFTKLQQVTNKKVYLFTTKN